MLKISAAIGAMLLMGSVAGAGYDEFDCRSSKAFENTYMQCISCGSQKYFADKGGGREVVPSEKWLSLLGTMTVQNLKLDASGKNKISANFEARENFQKTVISMMKDYGFCQKYLSKQRAKTIKDHRDSDIASSDWRPYVYGALTGNTNMSYKELDKIGKFYGFGSSMFGRSASENMNYVMINSPEPLRSSNPGPKDQDFAEKFPLYTTQPASERRPAFVKRLKEALGRGNSKSLIESGDKDNGLTECLAEIERMHDGKGDPLLNSFLQSPAESNKFCSTMANACDISADFCGNPPPASSKPNYKPAAPSNRMLPPPPRSGGNGVR